MLSRIVASVGGIVLVFRIILYYYINFVDKTYATSSSGLPSGAAFGIVAFVLFTYQSPKLRKAYKEKIMLASSAPQGSTTAPVSKTDLPSRTLLIVTPIILIGALVLMVVGSSI